MDATVQVKAAVLIIEDQSVQRMQAVDLVEQCGLEPIEASNASDALDLLQNRPDIKVIFSDIDPLDGEDGLKLLHTIRDRWPPVEMIMVSGKRHPKQSDLPLRGKFYSKPYVREQVANAIKELIQAQAADDGQNL